MRTKTYTYKIHATTTASATGWLLWALKFSRWILKRANGIFPKYVAQTFNLQKWNLTKNENGNFESVPQSYSFLVISLTLFFSVFIFACAFDRFISLLMTVAYQPDSLNHSITWACSVDWIQDIDIPSFLSQSYSMFVRVRAITHPNRSMGEAIERQNKKKKMLQNRFHF